MCFLCVYCCCCALRTGSILTAVYGFASCTAFLIIGSLILTASVEKIRDHMIGNPRIEDIKNLQTIIGTTFVAISLALVLVNIILLIGAVMEIADLILTWLILDAMFMLFVLVVFILRAIYSVWYSKLDLFLIFNTAFKIYLFWIVGSYYEELQEDSDSDDDD